MKLGAILSGNAQRIPDKIAVVCGDQQITFAELDKRSNQIANALLGRGIALGDRIAVLMPNGIELIEMLSGIVKTGALTVPLSPRLAEKEIEFILGHSKPSAIVFPDNLRGSVKQTLSNSPDILGICVGSPMSDEISLPDLVAAGDPTPPASLPVQPDDCVLGYTSGTTGLPKGAIGTHANLLAIGGLICTQEWELTGDDVIFASTPMSHRTGFSRLVNAFQLGCRLVLQPSFDPAEAVDIIAREKVTVLSGVPTIVRMMMDFIEAKPKALTTLRLIVTTGEVFPEPVKERLFKAVPDVGLYTYLAQTEAGVVTGMRPKDHKLKPGAMGRVLPGVEVRLVDADLKNVALGTPGEILVRCGEPGRFITMRAYFNDEKATDDVFVDGWLRTGDLAYQDEDGYMYFSDRAKDMIVSGGYNIYSREVELVLMEHEAVLDAAVFGVPDSDYGEAVAACIQCQEGKVVSAEELIAFCRIDLAGYKKPKHIHFIDAMPRTSAGKVQKYELKKQYIESA
jgi:long-chain acyl-CoA synthetase